MSIYESELPEKAKKQHSAGEQPDVRLIAIVKLLARIAAERDYNSLIHQYEE